MPRRGKMPSLRHLDCCFHSSSILKLSSPQFSYRNWALKTPFQGAYLPARSERLEEVQTIPAHPQEGETSESSEVSLPCELPEDPISTRSPMPLRYRFPLSQIMEVQATSGPESGEAVRPGHFHKGVGSPAQLGTHGGYSTLLDHSLRVGLENAVSFRE